MYCFTTSISHGVEKYFPRLWGMGISDAIFICVFIKFIHKVQFIITQNLTLTHKKIIHVLMYKCHPTIRHSYSLEKKKNNY